MRVSAVRSWMSTSAISARAAGIEGLEVGDECMLELQKQKGPPGRGIRAGQQGDDEVLVLESKKPAEMRATDF